MNLEGNLAMKEIFNADLHSNKGKENQNKDFIEMNTENFQNASQHAIVATDIKYI